MRRKHKTLKEIAGTNLWKYAEDGDEGKAFVSLAGLGGSADGFGSKYSRIAEYVQSDHGVRVFTVPTPEDVFPLRSLQERSSPIF